ncbi:MAG: ComEC/Rec2 family competence protein [Clostridia bacterium]|nr:ComEC/Rec2 family competence protein [Clostridia bacterium]
MGTALWLSGLGLCLLCALLLKSLRRSVYLPTMAAALLLGMLRCMAAQPALPPEGTYALSARVSGEASVREKDGRISVYLADVRLTGIAGAYSAYWTYWPDAPDAPLPMDGQEATFTGSVYHPMEQSNPHGFDFRLYLLQKGVTIGVTGCSDLTLTPSGQTAPASPLIRLRQALRLRLDTLLGDHGSLAAALVLNEKGDLPEDLAESFQLAGVAHVLAVSGLHVMILFSCILALLRRFSPSQAVMLMISAVLLTLYGMLAGMQAAVLRAALLMAYTLSGRILRRRPDKLTALAVAFLIILLLRPIDLFSAGFQMSFGAVLGLILLGDRMNRGLRRLRRPWLRTLLSAYSSTLCASLGAALPVAWYYHRLSLIGLVISPMIVLLVTVLLPMILLTLTVSFLWMAPALLLGRLTSLLCAVLTAAVRWSGALPFASFAVPRLPFYAMAAIVAALVLCTRYVLFKGWTRVIAAFLLLAGSAAAIALTRNTDVRYIQFSMGSADAAVIEDGSQTIVIDAGEFGGDVASYLLSEGRRADAVILSHLHADHALGLSELLRQRVPIGTVYLSTEALVTPVADSCRQLLVQLQEAGVETKLLSAGDRLETARVSIDVLWPEAGGANPLGDGNDFAMALRIDLDGITMLHMSDVSGAYEMRSAQPAQVLRVAHHGSASSTGERFLSAVSPSLALISTRRASDAALERLAQAGVLVYDTNAGGALTLTVRNGQASIRCFLK